MTKIGSPMQNLQHTLGRFAVYIMDNISLTKTDKKKCFI